MKIDGLALNDEDTIWDVKYIESITEKITELND